MKNHSKFFDMLTRNVSPKAILNRKTLEIACVIFCYCLFGYIFFHFIYSYSIRVPYADEWGLTDVVTDKVRPQYFFWQNNEHRAGTTFLIIQLLAHATHWNMLYETVTTGILIAIGAILALWLKWRYTKSITYLDCIIPILFFNVYQSENILWGINLNHVLPAFFLFVALYLFEKPTRTLNNHALLGVALLSAYSSFQGLIVCLIIMGFFLHQYIYSDRQTRKKTYIIYALGILAIIGSYFVGFYDTQHLGPQQLTFSFALQFLSSEINAAIGILWNNQFLAILPLTITFLLIVCIVYCTRERKRIRAYSMVALFFYSITFLFLILFGRGGLGLGAALTSRYSTYLIPLFFGAYLVGVLYLKGWVKYVALGVYCSFIFLTLRNQEPYIINAVNWSYNTEKWKTCYLRIADIDRCNTISNIQIYNNDNSEIIDRVNKLKTNHLNFFYP